ncbi:BBE domain-containing protein, partial [Nocardioides hankookensis]
VRSTNTRSYQAQMAAFAGSGARESFGATSHVAYDALDAAGIHDLLDQVQAAQSSGLKEAGISIDDQVGKVRDLAPGDTAFVHREALATVQYTATFPPGTGTSADAYVRGFRAAMVPHWGEHAYVNYADPTISDYQAAYFGANADRLAQARATYDPDGFFTQPQDF